MKEQILDIVSSQTGELLLTDIVMRVGFSVVLGGLIFLSYYISHYGNVYSKKFNVTLVILTVLTATVMIVIGNNVALSLGMVGALSIIRFRTSVKDSRDTVYIFWTIIVGICSGVGDFLVAAVGSAAVFVVLLFFGSVKNNNRILLVIRGRRDKTEEIRKIVFEYFDKAPQLKVNNSTEENIEFIYEISKKNMDKSQKLEDQKSKQEDRRAKHIIDRLYEVENMDYVNIVLQSDEIS